MGAMQLQAPDSRHSPNKSASFPRIGSYVAMLGVCVGAFFIVRHLGSGLTAPAPGPAAELFGAAGAVRDSHTLMHVLLALTTVIITARAMGALFSLAQVSERLLPLGVGLSHCSRSRSAGASASST